MRNVRFKRRVLKDASLVSHLIYQIGESDLLRRPSKEVNLSDISKPKIKSVISKLKYTLLEYKKLTRRGRGIAAVQLNIPLKIAVIYIDKKMTILINPKITKKSNQYYLYPEICMSANPIIAKVKRPSWVEVEYFDEQGLKHIFNDHTDLITSRVLQHEIDHMEGIINIDLVSSKDLILESDPAFFKNAQFESV